MILCCTTGLIQQALDIELGLMARSWNQEPGANPLLEGLCLEYTAQKDHQSSLVAM